jgi:hypothetical protein
MAALRAAILSLGFAFVLTQSTAAIYLKGFESFELIVSV